MCKYGHGPWFKQEKNGVLTIKCRRCGYISMVELPHYEIDSTGS